MIAALATLAFLAALWVVVLVAARTLEESGSKVIAALGGRSSIAEPVMLTSPRRVSPRYPAAQPQRARPRPALRAAA